VNGALSRQQNLNSGDKLGVGEFVLELVKTQLPANLEPSSGGVMGDVGIPSGFADPGFGAPAPVERVTIAKANFKDAVPEVEAPQDPIGRIAAIFEGKIMPNFYGMLMKTEFRSVAGTIFLVMGLIAVAGSVMPMQDLAEQSIRNEAFIRAKILSREIADRFSPNFANHTESQIDFSFLETEDSVKSIVITNPSLQIIAPVSRLNQIYAGGFEAVFALKAAKLFREGRDNGIGMVGTDQNVAVWAEPVKITDARQLKPQLTAMVVVAIDFSGNMIASGGLGVVYGTAAAIAGLAMLIGYLILMRLSAKPYEVLNEELDRILRGEITRVTQEFKMEETKALWENLNTAAQRMPKNASESMSLSDVSWDQRMESYRALSEQGKFAFLGLDPNLLIVSMNDIFTEASGIRSESVGQPVSVAADQALSALATDLLRVAAGSQTRFASDRFSFQGDSYDVIAIAISHGDQNGLAVMFKRGGG
jgi:PAS domain-containing protein